MATAEKDYKKIEELDAGGVQTLLERWNLEDFVEFAKDKHLDGRKLLDVSEGIVKLWKPKANAMVLINFVNEVKQNPYKYLHSDKHEEFDIIDITDCVSNIDIESQYQTIPIRKKEVTPSMSTVEDIIKRIVPAKSFLYRHQQKTQSTPSYLPMDAGTTKKRKIFRLSSYEYPFLDLKNRFSKQDNATEKGYYAMKRNSRYYIHRTYRKTESKTKYKSLSISEGVTEKYQEDHFYEDLNYSEAEEKIEKDKTEKEKTNTNETKLLNMKPRMAKIQELFQSFRVPFFRKHEILEEKKEDLETEGNLYENSDSAVNMYDSVIVNKPVSEDIKENTMKLPVEDYLEPVQVNKDYCDVTYKQKDESLLGYILSIFENRFGMRRETNDDQPEDSTDVSKSDDVTKQDGAKVTHTNMADRPLPVPVENEPYYMNIDRNEAQNLLKGHPDGTFILRPSSQPDHAYTLSVACADSVHNIGVRRRPDGRLALGYARRGEQSFVSVTSLLRHHKKRRLLLVAGGEVIGATTLNESPQYYQIPSGIPIQEQIAQHDRTTTN